MATALPMLLLLLAGAQPVEPAPVVSDSRFFALDSGQAEPRDASTIPLRTGQC